MVRLHSILLLYALLIVGSGSTLCGQCVRFDVANTVAAVDVSTPEFLASHPNEKLIRIRMPISSLVQLESEGSLLQYLYLISGTTANSFQIVDYAPKTTLATDVSGLISSEQSDDESTSIGVNALAPRDFPIKADASAKHSAGTHVSNRMEKLPPKQLVSASGTMHRGLSAYFKLKPSTQTTLEGDKTFEITVQVKRNWRASMMHVNCAAFAKPRSGGFSDKANVVCGQRAFVVGVHIAGDEEAKQSVEQLASTQHQLRQLASQHAELIEEKRYPSIGHKLGAALSLVKPRIPDAWLNELLTSGDFHPFERHLPIPIREAATSYRQARTQVIRFAG